ncbi:MAG: PIN domain-containing protein [Kiritimatiellae bacterium]|nr:PIN domain-containing protein [Kiritimatiellia bacterium]
MSPRWIVLDSNVAISSFLFEGPPEGILHFALEEVVRCFMSLPMLDEIRDVLQRPEFGLSSEQALTLVEELYSLCEVVSPTRRFQVIKADPLMTTRF